MDLGTAIILAAIIIVVGPFILYGIAAVVLLLLDEVLL